MFDPKKEILYWLPVPSGIFLPGTELLRLHSGQSLAWDYGYGDIDDPCDAIADFCGVVTIHEAIGGRRWGDADRCATR